MFAYLNRYLKLRPISSIDMPLIGAMVSKRSLTLKKICLSKQVGSVSSAKASYQLRKASFKNSSPLTFFIGMAAYNLIFVAFIILQSSP